MQGMKLSDYENEQCRGEKTHSGGKYKTGNANHLLCTIKQCRLI